MCHSFFFGLTEGGMGKLVCPRLPQEEHRDTTGKLLLAHATRWLKRDDVLGKRDEEEE